MVNYINCPDSLNGDSLARAKYVANSSKTCYEHIRLIPNDKILDFGIVDISSISGIPFLKIILWKLLPRKGLT